mgnify:CR=1 FL=1
MALQGETKKALFYPSSDSAALRRLDQALHLAALGLLPVSVLLIVHLALEPYNFALPQGGLTNLGALWMRFWNGVSDADDILNNYVFFMPLGLSLACLLERTRLGFLAKLLVILGAGASLSLAVELTQLFLPDRTSTRIDVLSNSIGCVLGAGAWFVARLWARSPAHLAGGLAVYIPLAVWALVAVPPGTTLFVWSASYPLIIGNERSGDRPWRGEVEHLQIAGRSLPEASSVGEGLPPELVGALLADYAWSSDGQFVDRSGNLPPLVPQPSGEGQASPGRLWLMTEEPAAALRNQIAATSEFTILTTVTTADPNQSGPARIISFSNDPNLRNFTLGQDGSDLIFRLRTPVTGDNGVWPQLRVPGVFADTAPHSLLLSYADGTLDVYVDGVLSASSLHLSREWALISYLIPPEVFGRVSDWLPFLSVQAVSLPLLICYALIYVPAGLLVTTLTLQWASWRQRLPIGLALALVFVAASQAVLWLIGGQAVSLTGLMVGAVLILGAYAAFSWCASTGWGQPRRA